MTQPGNSINPRRIVPVEGAYNFRDIGGYETSDGRTVKWGRVYRSGKLNNLTDNDRSLMGERGIRLVCDFRVSAEIETDPDKLMDDGSIEYLNLPVMHGRYETSTLSEKAKKGDMSWLNADFMIEGYRKNLDEFGNVWRTVIENISSLNGSSMVFHCTAGKDRAGTCAALVLLALGVPESTVRYDYDLSNELLIPWVEQVNKYVADIGIEPEKMRPFLVASEEYITTLLDHIHKNYGSASEYLRNGAGVSDETLEKLKKELLE